VRGASQIANCPVSTGANVRCMARVNIDTSHKSQHMCCNAVEKVHPYINTQQSGNCGDYIQMNQIFNPEIPGLEPPNIGISALRNMSGIPRDWNS
jgi:hypothetical protein